MARSKFRIDEDKVMDSVDEREVSGTKVEGVENEIKPIESDSCLTVAVNDESDSLNEANTSESAEKKIGQDMRDQNLNSPVKNEPIPVAQPGFNYKKKKEKRDVKKLLLITPTMNEQVITLLEKTYNGMPFNMLVNDLLKEFVEKHGIKIEDDTF